MAKNAFDYSLDFGAVDFRKQPELYRIGVGEQGVLLVQPYKLEILPHWRFRTEALATESAKAIYRLFEGYLKAGDFVGADMARKFLQMGFTQAWRYANYRSGRKYEEGEGQSAAGLPYPYSSGSRNKGGPVLEQEGDALTAIRPGPRNSSGATGSGPRTTRSTFGRRSASDRCTTAGGKVRCLQPSLPLRSLGGNRSYLL